MKNGKILSRVRGERCRRGVPDPGVVRESRRGPVRDQEPGTGGRFQGGSKGVTIVKRRGLVGLGIL